MRAQPRRLAVLGSFEPEHSAEDRREHQADRDAGEACDIRDVGELLRDGSHDDLPCVHCSSPSMAGGGFLYLAGISSPVAPPPNTLLRTNRAVDSGAPGPPYEDNTTTARAVVIPVLDQRRIR